MDNFYIVQYAENRWSFVGKVPPSLRGGYGKPITYHSKRDAEDAAFHNGYPFVEDAALVSSYGAKEWQ